MLRSLVFQLLAVDESLFPLIYDLHTQSGARVIDSFDEFLNLFDVFENMCKTLPGLQCVIDAVDECQDQLFRRKLMMERFRKLLKDSNCGMKSVLTSRDNGADIDEIFEACSHVVDVRPQDVSEDVLAFVRYRISVTDASHLRDSCIGNDIQSTLSLTTDGMFLWASLMLEDLEMARKSSFSAGNIEESSTQVTLTL